MLGPAVQLRLQIPLVISNHPDLEGVAKKFGVPFVCLPLNPKEPGSKEAQEAQIEQLLQEHQIDLIVLARYMQVCGRRVCRPLQGLRVAWPEGGWHADGCAWAGRLVYPARLAKGSPNQLVWFAPLCADLQPRVL